ncbi:MAG: 1-deoxy-D-xylulose-5-phosphate reductoisomerase [Chlamydiia bacterium]|nr:1-deoxy-D-xylulose-5-phosphate reductoisomerase [Chlamydiia bacterium]
MKRIAILGSTGTIGQSCLKVVRNLGERFKVVSLAVNERTEALADQILEFNPELVAVYNLKKAKELSKRFPSLQVEKEMEGLIAAACHPEVDIVVVAMDGTRALLPTSAAIDAGKNIALATKEVLVSAGQIIMASVKQRGVSLIPIDSEHSAFMQCLRAGNTKEVKRAILTYSGGPLRDISPEELENVTLERALNHPKCRMGQKATIDSSTAMNKGLEYIEASWLFKIPPEKIEVMLHPEGVIHGLLEFEDGSLIAQFASNDMAIPIQYALTAPDRLGCSGELLDFGRLNQLSLTPYRPNGLNGLDLAKEALRKGQSYPCYMNAANEVLVKRFIDGEIRWTEILQKLEKLLTNHRAGFIKTLDDVIAVDEQARKEAKK